MRRPIGLNSIFNSKFKKIMTLSFLSLSAVGVSAFAGTVKNDCFSQKTEDGINWAYCVTRDQDSKNPDVVYYFHGLTGSENSWYDMSAPLMDEWKKEGADAPTVVSLSFGTVWLLAPTNKAVLPGRLLDIVLNTAMPQIEKQLGGLHGKRILAGSSMGGFNATEVYLFDPKLFDRVALLCPALTEMSPFSDQSAFDTFIKKENADPKLVAEARDIGKILFKTEANWESVSPAIVGPLLLNKSYPRLFVSIGRQDDFGFFEEAENFQALARAKGVPNVEWYPVEGKHCSFDAMAFARFLIK